MKKLSLRNCQCALAVLLLTLGCNEIEERMAWSPDGTRAFLRSGNELRLIDTNGNISPVVVSNVESAAWLPDSKGLVLLRQLTVANWSEAVQLLPSNEIATVTSLARGIPDLLKGALAAADGDAEAMDKKFFEPLGSDHASKYISPALRYLLDTQPAALREAVAGCKNAGKLENDLSNLSTTTVAEISIFNIHLNQRSEVFHVIEHTIASLEQPRPSPSMPVVAFVRDDVLTVAPLDGSTNRVRIAEKVQGVYDWTPDGKSLVYAVPLADKWQPDLNLARIERRTVIDAAGAMIETNPLPLALIVAGFKPRVKSLPDGHLLFASLAHQFPTPAGAPQQSRLYAIDPSLGTNAVPVALPSAPGALPQDLAAFVPSPDGKQIAVVESGSDVVAVLDVATGALEVVSPNHGAKSRMLPAWRGNDELYFAAWPQPDSIRPELFRWRRGSAPQILSSTWRDAVVTNLLEKSK